MENSFDNAHFASYTRTRSATSLSQAGKIPDRETDYGFRRRDHRAGKKSAGGRPHHRHDRALDEAQDAQRMVYAVLPHDGHGISVGPQAPDLQFRHADRRRLDPARADPVPQRPRGALLDRRASRLGRQIIEEDREILESTDPDAIVDMSRKLEMHMPSDRPGMLMRQR